MGSASLAAARPPELWQYPSSPEMFKLKINNSKPKDWSRIPLTIHNQMCYYEQNLHDTRCEAKLISAKFLMLGMIYRCEIF